MTVSLCLCQPLPQQGNTLTWGPMNNRATTTAKIGLTSLWLISSGKMSLRKNYKHSTAASMRLEQGSAQTLLAHDSMTGTQYDMPYSTRWCSLMQLRCLVILVLPAVLVPHSTCLSSGSELSMFHLNLSFVCVANQNTSLSSSRLPLVLRLMPVRLAACSAVNCFVGAVLVGCSSSTTDDA